MPDSNSPRLVRFAGRPAWHIRHNGRRLSTGCKDRAGAERVLARYREGLETAALPAALGVTSLLSLYLENRREAGKPGAERLMWAHKQLARYFGEKPPDALTPDDAKFYAKRRRAEGVVDGTVRTEMQALVAALKWAHGKKMAGPPPVLELPQRSPARERWLSEVECDRLIAACAKPHLKLFVQIALHTAARSGAILALTWDRVDFEGATLDFRVPGRRQTRKRRVQAPINDTLMAALRAAHETRVCEFVVEWGGESVKRIKNGFASAAARAGLDGVTPHTLRHTAVTRMMQRGADVWQVAGLAGLTLEVLQEVYGHHHPDGMRAAAKKLG